MASTLNLTYDTSESNRDWRTMALSTVYAILQVVNLPFIIYYCPTHYPRDDQHSSIIKNTFPHHHLDSWIPDFASDPSPASFMLACTVYAFAAGFLYKLNATDRYQSRFLAGGIAAAVLLSSPRPMVSLPHLVDLKNWIPGMVTCSLLLSMAFHRAVDNARWRTRSSVEAEESRDEKFPVLEI